MLVTTNTSPSTSSPAITASNNSDAVVYYATQGMINVLNNAHLRALTGGGLNINNNAEVNYDSGLASAIFTNGPTGLWTKTSWQEINN